MKIEQQLQQKGFKEFKDPTNNSIGYVKSYQLRVRDDHLSTKYFINVDLYDFNLVNANIPEFLLKDLQPEYHVQFNSHGDNTFNVNCLQKDLDKVMEFYENMFLRMECEYCED